MKRACVYALGLLLDACRLRGKVQWKMRRARARAGTAKVRRRRKQGAHRSNGAVGRPNGIDSQGIYSQCTWFEATMNTCCVRM